MYLPIFSPVLLQAHCPFSLKLHFFGSMTWSGCHGNVWWLQPSTALAKATHGIPRAKCPSHTWASFHLILLRDLMSWPLPSAHCPLASASICCSRPFQPLWLLLSAYTWQWGVPLSSLLVSSPRLSAHPEYSRLFSRSTLSLSPDASQTLSSA